MTLFEEQLYVELPDSYKEMAEEKATGIYPYEEKPQMIFEDEEMHRFCTFSLLKAQKLAVSQTETAIWVIHKVVTGLYPSCMLDEPSQADCGEGKCGWFSFKTAGADGELFHLMYIYPINGSMMLGTMGCRLSDDQGKEQMMEILSTLKCFRKKYSYEILSQSWKNKK